MKRILSLIASLALCYLLIGQETLDILTLSGRYATQQAYDSVYTGKAHETGAMVGLTAPIPLSKKTIWYNNLTYFHWNVTNDEELPANITDPINLHGFILRTGIYQKFDKGRGLQVFFSPRLMSDFKNIGRSSYQFGGLAMYEKNYREGLKVSFGLLYNQELFGPYFVPLINLNWQLSEYWSITGLLPVYAKIKYQKHERLSMGISHFGLVTTYHLGDDNYKGDYIERQSIDLGLFARYRLVGNIYIEGRIGHTLGRSYAQYEAGQKIDFAIPLVKIGDNRVQKNVSFEDGVIANLRLVYNIPIPEDD